MNKIKMTVFFVLAVFLVKAQQNPAEFTLQGAIDYAMKHNANYLNTEADAKYNKYKRNEVLGQGLPQINSSFDVKDNAILPTSLLPGIILGPLYAGQFIPVKFGVQYNATAGVSASQLIFNSNYIVGLQASKELMNLSQKNILRSKIETAQNVSKAYYGVLVNRERIKILDLNIARIKTLKDNTSALNQNGFVEKIDVDRLEVGYNNLMTDKEKTLRLVELSETVLKFQMGYDFSQPITLTDNLDKTGAEDVQNLVLNDKPDLSKRPEFLVMQSQQKLNELDLKRYRLNYLPTIGAYGSYSQMFQKNSLDFSTKSWYPFAIVGATINIGIFDGLQTNWRIQEAKITLLKTQNSFNQLKQALDMEAQNAAVAYKNALASLQTQKRNIDLAQNIFDVVKKKYEQGIGSSLEVNTAENDLQQAQTNYYNVLYDLIVAKIDYQKATGTLVK